MFMRIPLKMPEWAHTSIKLGAYGVATAMLLCTDYANGAEFNLFTSNIIILLLANMALFGSLTYLLTMYSWWARVAVLAALAGVVLSAQADGSWAQMLRGYTPVPWMHRFEYLRYLFIVCLDDRRCRSHRTAAADRRAYADKCGNLTRDMHYLMQHIGHNKRGGNRADNNRQ